MGAICVGKEAGRDGKSMAPGDGKIILGQQTLWQGKRGRTAVHGTCLTTYTGGCGRHLCLGGVAVSPVHGGSQAVPQHQSITEYLQQGLGPRR